MSDKTNWLQNIPGDIRSYIFLIFTIGLLIFIHNYFTLSDYAERFEHLAPTEESQYSPHLLVLIIYFELIIHFGFRFFVNVLLIWLIVFNVAAITRSWKSKKVSKSLYEHEN